MSKTTIIARVRSDGTVVQAPDGTERLFPDMSVREMTEEERRNARPVSRVKTLRRAIQLTQEEFASRFHIPLGTLRDWEQGRCEPDQTAQAYLKVIANDPKAVERALQPKAIPV